MTTLWLRKRKNSGTSVYVSPPPHTHPWYLDNIKNSLYGQLLLRVFFNVLDYSYKSRTDGSYGQLIDHGYKLYASYTNQVYKKPDWKHGRVTYNKIWYRSTAGAGKHPILIFVCKNYISIHIFTRDTILHSLCVYLTYFWMKILFRSPTDCWKAMNYIFYCILF